VPRSSLEVSPLRTRRVEATVSLNDAFGSNRSSLVEAQVAIIVRYQLPLIHWKREKRFPMFAKRASNGNFYWYADTLPKN